LDELNLLKNNQTINDSRDLTNLQNEESNDISEFIVQNTNVEFEKEYLTTSNNKMSTSEANLTKLTGDDENFDIINVDDIDFGLGVDNINFNKLSNQVKNKTDIINTDEKKINVIRIGKKKK
jgi:hypothetical protein